MHISDCKDHPGLEFGTPDVCRVIANRLLHCQRYVPAPPQVCPSCGAEVVISIAMPRGRTLASVGVTRLPAVCQEQPLPASAATVLTLIQSCCKQTPLRAHRTASDKCYAERVVAPMANLSLDQTEQEKLLQLRNPCTHCNTLPAQSKQLMFLLLLLELQHGGSMSYDSLLLQHSTAHFAAWHSKTSVWGSVAPTQMMSGHAADVTCSCFVKPPCSCW